MWRLSDKNNIHADHVVKTMIAAALLPLFTGNKDFLPPIHSLLCGIENRPSQLTRGTARLATDCLSLNALSHPLFWAFWLCYGLGLLRHPPNLWLLSLTLVALNLGPDTNNGLGNLLGDFADLLLALWESSRWEWWWHRGCLDVGTQQTSFSWECRTALRLACGGVSMKSARVWSSERASLSWACWRPPRTCSLHQAIIVSPMSSSLAGYSAIYITAYWSSHCCWVT